MMVAEVLGVPATAVRTIVADTASIGFTFLTGGSRVTFATGMAATQAAEKVVDDLKRRAAMTWEIPVDAVEWKDGMAFPAGSNAGAFEPLDLAALALKAGRTGGPINAEVSVNAQGAGAGLRRAYLRRDGRQGDRPRHDRALHRDPGRRQGDPSQLRRRPDPGRRRAGHRLGAERGVHLQRQGPDGECRASWTTACPVASDVPMIEAVLVEVPNPRHPFGARGVGEVPIVPPMAAIANAIRGATGAADARPADVAAEGPRGARRRREMKSLPKVVISSGSVLPAVHRWPDGVRGGGDHLPPAGPGTGTAVSRAWASRSRKAWRSPSTARFSRTPIAAELKTGQRDRTDPEDRWRLEQSPFATAHEHWLSLSFWRALHPIR